MKVKPLFERKVGFVPLKIFLGTNDKGKHVASTKVEGKTIAATGSSQWFAQNELKKKLAEYKAEVDE